MKTDPNSPAPATPVVKKHTYGRHRANRTFKGSDCWVHSPGNTQFLRQSEWDLERVAVMNGMETLDPTRLQVANVKGERKIYVWPADSTDPDALEMRRNGGRLWVNLSAFLTECNLALPVNVKERFHLVITPDAETPPDVPAALCLDLDSPLERRTMGKRRKKEPNPAAQGAAGEQL